MRGALLGTALFLFAQPAFGQECKSPAHCVEKEDLDVMLAGLREKKCLLDSKPTFALDPIVIVIDKEGRIYGSGSDPKPYRLKMRWCTYEVDAEGTVHIQAAMKEEPEWGLRFRPKAALGYVPSEALATKEWQDGIDGGLLLEPFYWRYLNLNVQVGVRSFGLGLGLDLTRNFGVYAGYSMAWGSWRSSPHFALWFSFL